jgi:Pyruvate/2-oxoacid:ferredoxin oxidoreductase gamma subunit
VNEIAQQQGSQRVANVVMLGACLTLSRLVQRASIVAAIEEVLGHGKQHLLAINLNALEAGLAFASPVPV